MKRYGQGAQVTGLPDLSFLQGLPKGSFGEREKTISEIGSDVRSADMRPSDPVSALGAAPSSQTLDASAEPELAAAALPDEAAGTAQGWGAGGRPVNDPGFSPGGLDNGNDGEPNDDTGPNGVGTGFGSGGRPQNDPDFTGGAGASGNRPDDAGPPDWAGDGDGEGPDRPGDAGNPGMGNGDGDGDGVSDRPEPAPTPPDVPLLDPETVQYKSSYTFKIGDITVGLNGERLGYDADGNPIDPFSSGYLSATPLKTTKEGVELYGVDSEFGFYVTDFVGAQDKLFDGDFAEGFVGELSDGSGIVISDARTDQFIVPAKLGTWLVGIGGNSVKASTEHYSVMQAVLSNQLYPDDPSALYNLDDDLWLVDYKVLDDGMPDLDAAGKLQTDDFHHFYLSELVAAMGEAEGLDETSAVVASRDFDKDGVIEEGEVYKAYMADRTVDGVVKNVAVLDFVNNNDTTDDDIDFQDGGLNGFGLYGIQDFLVPNESTVLEDIAVGDDYSVTVKDDGKLLYRWGNMVKRPNDMRVDAKLDLPDEWTADTDGDGLVQLYRITAAELVINHTVTNNPNDQVRPEDFENEAAIGQLPEYVEVRDPFDLDADGNWAGNVLWVSPKGVYAGDGTFLPSFFTEVNTGTVVEDLAGNPVGYYNPGGTVLRDFSLIDLAANSTLGDIGALSSDLTGGFTEAYYTTMDREPFVADLNEDGTDYDVGPRWRLQPDKYGQDLPSVTIPQDPSDPPPVENGEEKYEVGADTTTVLNLLDWAGTSPLALSAGWMTDAGGVSVNGLNMTTEFDVAFYVKGDIKPVNLYGAGLLMEYEEVAVHEAGTTIDGTIFGNTLVGKGGNTFDLSGSNYDGSDGQADLFIFGYGAETVADLGFNEVYDFSVADGDALGLIGFGLDPDNYNLHIGQTIDGDNLNLSMDAGDGSGRFDIATLYGVAEYLEADSFYFA